MTRVADVTLAVTRVGGLPDRLQKVVMSDQNRPQDPGQQNVPPTGPSGDNPYGPPPGGYSTPGSSTASQLPAGTVPPNSPPVNSRDTDSNRVTDSSRGMGSSRVPAS